MFYEIELLYFRPICPTSFRFFAANDAAEGEITNFSCFFESVSLGLINKNRNTLLTLKAALLKAFA
jgi:hypothetical protein